MRRFGFLLCRCICVAAALVLGWVTPGQAQNLIRDSETESIIRDYAAPVFRAANLNADDVEIYIVSDNSLNAFVAGGQKMFINTGLLMRSEDPGQVIGVIAHEAGHIAGGHLVRMHDQLARSSAASIVGLILGGAAALATGRADVGTAVAIGGQGAAARSFLSYSRAQEAAADQAALTYLDAAGISSRGLLDFMKVLGDQELLITASQDPYVRSHPLTQERIAVLENHVQISPYGETPSPPELVARHARLRAKLMAYLQGIGPVLRTYRRTDQSVPARYARAIGFYRKADIDRAEENMQSLLREFPDDPYFHETRGQGMFENGNAKEAYVSYSRAAELLPDAMLLRVELARVQLALGDPALLPQAIENLTLALQKESRSPSIWDQLGIAHQRNGDEGRGRLAQAEAAFLRRNYEAAKFHAGRATQLFSTGTREWLQAQDIENAASNRLDDLAE